MPKTVVALEATINSSEAEGSVKSLKAQLKEAQQDVQVLSDKFGATSEQAVNAAKKAADLRDRIGDAKALTDAFNPDAKFKAFSSALQGVVGGFSALQGAQALFGAESEDLQKVLVKVQSAMALSQGLNSIMEAKDAFMILGTVIKTNVVAAFSTLKGAIMTTGIGALIVAVGLLINYFSNLADEAEKAAEAQKKLNEETKKYADVGLKGELDYLERTQKLELARAKNKGKSEQEIFDLEQDFRRQKGRALQRHYDEIKNVDQAAAADTMNSIKNLQVEIEVAELEHQTKLKEQRKSNSVNKKTEIKIEKEDLLAAEIDRMEREVEADAKYQAELDKNSEDALAAEIDRMERQAEIDQKFKDDEIARAAAAQKAKQDINNLEIGAAQDLVGLLKGLGEKNKALQKATLIAGGALSIAQIINNTNVGSSKEVASKGVLGLGTSAILYAKAAISIASVIAATAKGLSALGGGGGVTGGPTGAGGGGTTAPVQPQVATTTLNQGQVNQLASATSRAFVLETDISGNQERIQRLNRAARIN